MRLSSIFLVAAATLVACGAAVSAGADLEQTRFSTAAFRMWCSRSTLPPKKKSEVPEKLQPGRRREGLSFKDYPFLIPESAAIEMAKRMTQQLDDALLAKVKKISNGEKPFLTRWKKGANASRDQVSTEGCW
ncbi:hypothetical protein Pcac1_g5884 [Phytophthora cactorum]|nr:hypothetical protein Pcac1_g5884 [Phytophthora cactorum]